MLRPHTLGFCALLSFIAAMYTLVPDKSLASPAVLGVSNFTDVDESFEISNLDRLPKTSSPFEEKTETEEESIAFEVEEVRTDELYLGEQEVVQEGQDGKITREYRIESWNGTVFERQLISSRQTDPVNRVVRIGTKVKVEQLSTPDGQVLYSQVIRMWATSYDGNCVGCSGITATGTTVKHGVCAVDPRVIPLGSRMYIPGYGTCRAEDTGGAIKGNKIDLGFENVRYGWWSARYTDVYVLID